MPIWLEVVARYDESAHTTQLRARVYHGFLSSNPESCTVLHERHRELVWDEGQGDSVRIDALKAIQRFSDAMWSTHHSF